MELTFAMIRVQKCKQGTKILHIKFLRLLARWQEISDLFKTHGIGWGTIQPHHHMYDVMFLVKSLKNPSPIFHITDYVSFSHSSTRSSSTNKLQDIHSRNNYIMNFYFNRLPRIWNSLPPIDLSLPTIIIKTRLYKFFWNHFLLNFQSDNPCSLL